MKYPKYPAYKDSGVEWVGEIPDHWIISRLRYVADCLDGQRIPLNAEQRSEIQGMIPYWGANSIVDHIDQWLFDEELVLLGEDGAPFFDKLKSVAFRVDGKIWPNNHVHVLRPRSNMEPSFLTYFLNIVDYSQHIDGSTRDKLTQSNMSRIPVLIPSHQERRQIAAFLDSETAKIDTLIAKQERLITLLQEKRQTLISHAVTRGLNPDAPMKDSGVEWLGEVPAHWEVTPTKRIFSLIVDPAPPDNDYELLSIYTAIGVKPRQELEERGNRATTTDGYLRVRVGDIIVNKLLAWMGAIGVSEYEGVTSPAYDILRPSSSANSRYYSYLFRCGICLTEFKRYSRGIMEMRLRLYFDQLGRIKLPVPPLHEQNEIINYLENELSKLDDLVTKAQNAIQLLQERRTALISAAVTGKIDVRTSIN